MLSSACGHSCGCLSKRRNNHRRDNLPVRKPIPFFWGWGLLWSHIFSAWALSLWQFRVRDQRPHLLCEITLSRSFHAFIIDRADHTCFLIMTAWWIKENQVCAFVCYFRQRQPVLFYRIICWCSCKRFHNKPRIIFTPIFHGIDRYLHKYYILNCRANPA